MAAEVSNEFTAFLNQVLARLDASEALRLEFQPHVIVALEDDLVSVNGPYPGVHAAMAAADRAEAVLNEDLWPGEVRTRLVVVPLYPPHQEFAADARDI
jgi:hypothetical protein